MLLKKQTVWLLTMLSLIIVLSVYYITSPGQSPSEKIVANDQKQAKEQTKNKGKESAAVTAPVSSDKLAEIRLKKADDRKKLAEQYQEAISSSKSTAKSSKAYDKLEALNTLSNSEKLLEDMIKSKGYSDAVVDTSGNDVNVYVASDNMSSKQAAQIVNMTHEYLGNNKLVSVKYETSK
ncbi:stage III sporulation protein AH [Scopulibacillus daqui]|uniref:Stage III sporulation protein AH n=1 Tax=Scopulibacillus daqui TaxID=1469162 RepID=A0ABS2Q210_9BACL|nr:SpoIIIAH-like family protein [Scopulibacillus daqui]MBM7646325.1 stage III sporulation protein AH [Scopulibacillus daqui]